MYPRKLKSNFTKLSTIASNLEDKEIQGEHKPISQFHSFFFFFFLLDLSCSESEEEEESEPESESEESESDEDDEPEEEDESEESSESSLSESLESEDESEELDSALDSPSDLFFLAFSFLFFCVKAADFAKVSNLAFSSSIFSFLFMRRVLESRSTYLRFPVH